MKKPSLNNKYEIMYFCAGLIVFFIAASFGWVKLRYGFNFIDEGYHMVESWRLSVGDNLFKDKLTDTLLLYTLFNSLIFKISPNISLLSFREIQFFFTIAALLFFSFAIASSSRKIWYIPFVFSLFAFTGLDPIGMIHNLNYYTYPHFFITLYISFLILGIFCTSKIIRMIFYIFAGLSLWCISLSVLYLGVVSVTPLIIYYFLNKMNKNIAMDFKEFCCILIPFIACWLIFLISFNKQYIDSVVYFSKMMVKSHWTFHKFNLEALEHVIVSGLFLSLLYFIYKEISLRIFLLLSTIISMCMLFIIKTSFFGIIKPYYWGWFSKPMWLSSLFLCAIVIYWFLFVKKIYYKEEFPIEEVICFLIITPCTIQFIASSILSTNGVLLILHSAIPLSVAVALMIFSIFELKNKDHFLKLFLLIIVFMPFYFYTATADWKFTFFDVEPKYENIQIAEGFGKGIYTNIYYYELYKWIYDISGHYSSENDYIISYIVSPMVYMISHRKPALDHTFTSFSSRPLEFYERSIEKMVAEKRNPKLAFIFERSPVLIPSPNNNGQYAWVGKEFTFFSNDPISNYIKRNMYFLDQINLNNNITVICYTDNPLDPAIQKLKRVIEASPKDPRLYSQLGNLFMNKRNYLEAANSYKNSLLLSPNSVDVLNKLAGAYSQARKYDYAIATLQKAIEFQPQSADSFYNLACIFSRANKGGEAVHALTKAIGLGFKDCKLLKEDPDLNAIRGSAPFGDVLKKVCPD